MLSTGSMTLDAVCDERRGTARMIRSCRVEMTCELRASAASAEISSAVLGLSGRRRSNGRLMKCVSRISGSMIQIATCNGRAAYFRTF